MHKAITLTALNQQISNVLHTELPSSYWVSAEISQVNLNKSGHCYLNLIDKDKDTLKIHTQIRGVIWSNKFRVLRPYFEQTTGHYFQEGIKVLIKVNVNYHILYGISLNITDIDPSYTLGDIARQRLDTIRKLEATGMMDMNKSTDFPVVFQNVAVISSASAAGYGDFINELTHNSYNYNIKHTLFDTYMQGEQTPKSVTNALDKIYKKIDKFDAVLIIRGGGSKTDLRAFDNYDIAINVMQSPIPITTGIGHEQDESITDMVAHTSLKTPTATAEFIIAHNQLFESNFIDLYERIIDTTQDLLYKHKLLLQDFSHKITSGVRKHIHKQNELLHKISTNTELQSILVINKKNRKLADSTFKLKAQAPAQLREENQRISNMSHWLSNAPYSMLRHKKQDIERYQQLVRLANPVNILKRGYSISSINGKSLKSIKDIKEGSVLKTQLSDGELISVVEKKMK